jgi:4-amino-4-deoxy-L-arabinose transferase-like glycosyltransferase
MAKHTGLSRDRKYLGAALLAGLVVGVVFVFLTPAWQHYDEPTHFEYAWLIANRLSLPKPGDYDLGMRLDVARSMFENNFFEGMAIQPDLTPSDKPAWIGYYTQLNDPPLYYVLAAVPLRLMSSFSVQDQLYAARLFSLALFLVSILAAYGVTFELTPEGNALRLFVPLGMVCLPGLADIMTAMNNDVGAVAFFSLFVWACVRLLRRGFSLGAALGALVSLGMGLLTKETTYIGVPLLAVALLFSVLRGRYLWLAWALSGMAALAALLAVFTWGDAPPWVRRSFQEQPTRARHAQAPHGEHALLLEVGPQVKPGQPYRLYQLLPIQQAQSLQGKTITIGAWIWADRPAELRTPNLHLYEANQDIFQVVSVGVEPSFFAFTETINTPSWRAWIELAPLAVADPAPLQVYYDGVVLAEGSFPAAQPPQFANSQADGGVWAGKSFVNLVRNASAESAGLRVRLWADRLGASILPDQTRPSWIVGVLLDLRGAGWFHREIGWHMFRTFWGRFGWGHVLMLGSRPYRALAIFTGLALAGAAAFLWRRRRMLPLEMLLYLGLTASAAWLMTLVRSENYVLLRIYYPAARYAYPAIIPTLLLLHAGWSELYRPVSQRLPRALGLALYCLLMAIPLFWGLASIWKYYYG